MHHLHNIHFVHFVDFPQIHIRYNHRQPYVNNRRWMLRVAIFDYERDIFELVRLSIRLELIEGLRNLRVLPPDLRVGNGPEYEQ